MAKLEKLVDDLSGLSVMEAAELSKLLEDKWGVSAAVPVAVAAAGAGPGEAAAAAEVKDDFTIVLAAYGDKKIAVVMVDIDHFKRVNDEHGHQAGDRVLVAVAGAIAATARESDIVTRYGGDEFAAVMPHTVIGGALRGAERIRRAIERLTTELANGGAVQVTASLGVSRFGAGCNTPEALIEAADAALYEAKGSGRNRVCSNDALAEAA